MIDNRRNISPGIFALVLMIVFFSFFYKEKDKHHEPVQAGFSYTNSQGSQAILAPGISNPGTGVSRITKLNAKFPYPESGPGRELILNSLVSSCYSSYQLEFHSNITVIALLFPQKVPEQGTEDDALSLI